MKLYIAGIESHINIVQIERPKFVLFSYAHHNAGCLEYIKSIHCKDYIMDSGAFTFMNGGKQIDFIEYARSYAEYVRDNNIEKYIELDLYNVIGVEETEEIRKLLFQITGRKPIPVFHKSLGLDYFIALIEQFDYIAIGGIVTKHITNKDYKYFEYFIKLAHSNNCKVHGLGLTSQKNIAKYNFDSVDSTTWIRGRFGDIYYYDNGRMRTYKKKNSRLKDSTKANQFCLNQWIKFQKYAEHNL